MEIVQERLDREFDMDVITTVPNVSYRIYDKQGEMTEVHNPGGMVADADQLAAWNNANIRKPTLGFADYAREHGLLCGILESGEEQGYLAGAMAREVLERGVDAGTLPLRINRKGLVLLNLKTAERLQLLIPYDIIKAAETVIQ